MRLLFVLLSLVLSVVVAQDISFVNPPPGGEVGEYSQNPTFVLGSVMNIQWTAPEDTEISMVLYQNRPEDQFEYVFTERSNITSYRWNVGTEKSLSNGNVFFFQIFIVGETAPAAGSHYFNITRGVDSDDTTTTSSTTSSTPTPSPTLSTTSSAATSASVTPTTSSLSNNGDGGGLSTGAKVGMGVGIPVAVILGIAAGWFIFGRKKKETTPETPIPAYAPPNEGHYAPPNEGHYAPNAMQEQSSGLYKPSLLASPHSAPSEIYTPPTEPVEMPNNPATQRY